VYARRVNFNFNPLSFKSKNIQITRLKFEDAFFNMERYKSDSVWNYNLIAPPSNKKKEPGEMPDFIINADDIQFFRSRFVYRDSLNSIRINSNPEYPHMDYTDFEIRDIFGDIDVKLFLKKNIYQLEVDELTANEKYSGFSLKNLYLNAELSEKGISVDDIKIETPRSNISVSGNLHNLNIFKPVDISKVSFDLSLWGGPIDAGEAQFFANTGIKIKDADEIEIETSGKLDDLTIKKLKIKKNFTSLDMKGKVRNILNIENFNYSAVIEKSTIYRKDVIGILPEFEQIIPKIGFFNLKKIKANGYLDSVYCDFDFDSEAGNSKGFASIMYLDDMNYNINLSTENIDLSQITDNPEMKSSITGDFIISGKGITPEKIAANANVNIINSYFSDFEFKELKVIINSNDDNIIHLDTLYIEMPRNIRYNSTDDIFTEDNAILFADGYLNLQNTLPGYSLNVNYSAIDISELTNNKSMPEHISGRINLNSSGFEPDDIEGELICSFDELLFDDRALFPFDLSMQISHPDSLSKDINVNTDFFDFSLSGKYSFQDLISNFQIQSDIILGFSENITNVILNNEDKNDKSFINNNFANIDAVLTGNIKNISPLTAFIDNTDLLFSGDFNFEILSDSSYSLIKINKFDINNFYYHTNSINLSTGIHSINGDISFSGSDTLKRLSGFNFNLIESSKINFNGNNFDSTSLNINFTNDEILWNAGVSYNETIYTDLTGDVLIKDSLFDISFSDFNFDYPDIINIKNKHPLDFTFYKNIISINNFSLAVDSSNNFDLFGDIAFRKEDVSEDSSVHAIYFDDFKATLIYNDLQNFRKFLPEDISKKLSTLNADLTKFEIILNGDVTNPNLQLSSEISDLTLQGFQLGRFNTEADLNNFELSLSSKVIGNNNKEYLMADLQSLILNSQNFTIDSTSKIIANIKMSDLPLPLASPFIPMIKDMTGNASSDINISGYALDPEINGILNLNAASFILETNNVKYFADGDVNFTIDEIETDNLVLKNTKKDSENGTAKVKAKIRMKNFAPEYFDISAVTRNFKLLGNASQDAMPDLYGDLIISTGNNPIKFEGSLDDPQLSGDVNVVYADLKMPEFTEQQNAKTQLRYQIVGDKIRHSIKNNSDSLIRIQKEETSDIMSVMDFNMRVKLLGQVSVLIDLGALGEIYANVTMENQDEDLIYQKNTEKKSENLTGRIILKDNSTFKSFKVLQTSGEISFPTGEIDNPYLDLEATYKGTTMINNQPKQYTVIMYISGSQEQPKVRFTYLIDGQEAVGDEKQIEEDAILLLVAGRTKSSSGQGAASPDMLQQSLNSGISNYGSQLLTDFLMKTGSIQSVDLDFKGEGFDEATVKFTGQTELFGGNVNWTIGGALSDFSGNNEIILDVPLTNYTDNEFWRNFIFQFTRASHTNTTIQDQNSKNWEIKFKVGGSF
jgi:hypothetical protein